jgi:hypothetical protein
MIEGRRSPAEIRDSFRQALEAAHNAPSSPSKVPDRPVLVAAAEAELFSGRPLVPLPAASNDVPTYLFSSPLRTGWARLRFTHEDVGMRRFIVLTHDALYCFESEVFCRRQPQDEQTTFPTSTVPLMQCNAHTDPDRHRIELLSRTGEPVSVLVNHAVHHHGDSRKNSPLWGVSSVELQPGVVLELLDGTSSLSAWADALESACWSC